MLLKELTLLDEQAYHKFVQEWAIANESIITPMSANLNEMTFPEWLDKLKKDKNRAKNDFVPADTLFFEVGNKLVGAVQLRYELTEGLLQIGGNIGYGIVPCERGKGYASCLLKQALSIFQTRGFSKVMLTCDKTNNGSQKVIQKNGGRLTDEYLVDGKMVQRYWIELNGKKM